MTDDAVPLCPLGHARVQDVLQGRPAYRSVRRSMPVRHCKLCLDELRAEHASARFWAKFSDGTPMATFHAWR